MAEALDELRQDNDIRRILIIKGATKAPVVGEIAAEVFGAPVTVPEPDEYVALCAARQAAWALTSTREPPHWLLPASRFPLPASRFPLPASRNDPRRHRRLDRRTNSPGLSG
ncbi:FGGY-family carbohydrate kinase [Streptomyces sp. NPDC002589]|uniref:FGGY-family carbohydrate kinase n=1 Tax=Streptomyces sp. NPDC002589 TaxID=3154420 RepID=UPI00332E4401